MIEMKGEFTAQMTPEGANYFYNLMNTPRKVVMTVDPVTMSKIRKVPAGGTLQIESAASGSMLYKILRRDWKRCKLHLMEVK